MKKWMSDLVERFFHGNNVDMCDFDLNKPEWDLAKGKFKKDNYLWPIKNQY